LLCTTLLIVPAALITAQQESGEYDGGYEVIELPEAEVVEEQEHPNRVTKEQMEREGSSDLWEALRNVPGLIRSGGGEDGGDSFRVRGFDSSRMPVFIDGVPFESPYRGDADYSRLLTADIEEVEVQKGFSSMLMGANTMGGAILLQTAKPKDAFELGYKTFIDFDGVLKYSGSLTTFDLGAKRDAFYAKGVFQLRAIDHWRLSNQFVPFYESAQKSGERLNSGSNDLKITLLGGWTPAEHFSINGSFTALDAAKGVSPPDVNRPNAALYDWPLWKRYTVRLDAGYQGADRPLPFYGKGLVYFDKFDTELKQSAAYTLDMENDDYILGSRLEGGLELNDWNTVKAAFNLKRESHKRKDNAAAALSIAENTFSGGAEYETRPLVFNSRRPLALNAGLGFDVLQPTEFWSARDEERTSPRYMFSWQAGAFFSMSPRHTLRLTYAKKNHIPSMWQRYEQVFEGGWDDSIPNPNLKNESASHYELGYRGVLSHDFNRTFKTSVSIDAAVYYADLLDMIAEGDVSTSTGGTTKMRVNIDKTAYYGFEMGLTLYLCRYFSAGGALSVNRYEIKEGASGYHIEGNFPRTSAGAYMVITPFAAFAPRPLQSLAVTPSFEYEGPRYSRFTRLGTGAVMDRYLLVSVKLSSELSGHFTVSAGIENLFDANYYLDNVYSPMPGRSFNFGIAVKY
jgi:iron complex outermembrane receptor protein